jgi:exonuclease SbcD
VTSSTCSILHTSDIHLDNQVGLDDQPSAAEAGLTRVVDKALELDVDLFLLAGDLFDHNRVKDHCLAFATEQLARVHCPVVMITGNHDCLTDYSVYHRYDPTEAGDHVHFIREEEGGVVHFPALGVKIWGKGIVDHEPDNKPLGLLPAHTDDAWNIGMTHGYYVERGAGMYSSLITPAEIENSRFHYLALGHVHVFAEMQHGNTLAVYSGSPNIDQGVKEMTAAHIQLHPQTGVSVERVLL